MRSSTAKQLQANRERLSERIESRIFLIKTMADSARLRMKQTNPSLLDSVMIIAMACFIFLILCLLEWLHRWG